MGFMDKLKETAGKAAEKASAMKDSAMDTYGKMKEANEQKKAEKQAYTAAMEQEVNEYSAKLIESITAEYADGGAKFWGEGNRAAIDKFTKDYYEMLVLPGSRPNISCLTMSPYIDEKAMKKFADKGGVDLQGAVPHIFIKDGNDAGIVITEDFIAFKFRYEKDSSFWVKGKIPTANINTFVMEINDSAANVMVNGVKFTTIRIKGSYRQDFMSLNYYFECLGKQDFTIDRQEVNDQIRAKIGDKIYAQVKKYFIDDDEQLLFNDQIRAKIGDKIYAQVKKYFIDDDEQLLFYAGGLDSLAAVDYVACTDNQLIFVNREMLGATANVKQFYFEDVTSMSTIQNSTSSDFLTAVIDTALTAAFKLCDLEVSVAGSKEVINTLYLAEATRIIAIYHEMRKNAKKAAAQPIQVQAATAQPDALEQLQKLAQLKDVGIISEEEFAAKKADLLSKI